jgi:hypothetical protein
MTMNLTMTNKIKPTPIDQRLLTPKEEKEARGQGTRENRLGNAADIEGYGLAYRGGVCVRSIVISTSRKGVNLLR